VHFRYQAYLACITAHAKKRLFGIGTPGLSYTEHFHITSQYCNTCVPLYLVSNMETLRNIIRGFLEAFGEEAPGTLISDCRLSIRVKNHPQISFTEF
jgi:hypothetical protein